MGLGAGTFLDWLCLLDLLDLGVGAFVCGAEMSFASTLFFLLAYMVAMDLGLAVTWLMYREWCRSPDGPLGRWVLFLGWLGSTIAAVALWQFVSFCPGVA